MNQFFLLLWEIGDEMKKIYFFQEKIIKYGIFFHPFIIIRM
jgi:hypothetical protein